MSKTPSLSKFLKQPPEHKKEDLDEEIKALQQRMLKVQQGLYHRGERAIFAFEGFDAAGKGGIIRTITEMLDPRGIVVHAIGAPNEDEKKKHYLYRFWNAYPDPGVIAIFDRTWYGRVLVEKVQKLTPEKRIDQAYEEIRQFERMLVQDGVHLLKFFVAITPEEQLKRFEARLEDPYKRWKLGESDIRDRGDWETYVKAVDRMFDETHVKGAHWHLIPGDDKPRARRRVLETVTGQLGEFEKWMNTEAAKLDRRKMAKALGKLERV